QLPISAKSGWSQLRDGDADELESGLDRPSPAHRADGEGDIQFLEMSEHRGPDAGEVILEELGLGRSDVIDVLGEGGRPRAELKQRLKIEHPSMDVQEARKYGPILGLVQDGHGRHRSLSVAGIDRADSKQKAPGEASGGLVG